VLTLKFSYRNFLILFVALFAVHIFIPLDFVYISFKKSYIILGTLPCIYTLSLCVHSYTHTHTVTEMKSEKTECTEAKIIL
jgi:hypothetical protein